MQVNISQETKYGLSPRASRFLDLVQDSQGIKICGLMTIAPFEDDRKRPVFRKLRQLRDELAGQGCLNLSHLLWE